MTDSQQTDNHSTKAQGARLVQALRLGPVSTIDAARQLDIIHPPATVRWLRNRGYDIRTDWAYCPTEPGRRPHRVGLYSLYGEPV
ncbi:helix-turn-helix domain-containing protein [Pseudomonas helleri]|uniref:helix-turn-helix domain-containing protein n=1 Tax=Pseudomonas helleri TaxID=1608996 RepID=UPI003F99144E